MVRFFGSQRVHTYDRVDVLCVLIVELSLTSHPAGLHPYCRFGADEAAEPSITWNCLRLAIKSSQRSEYF